MALAQVPGMFTRDPLEQDLVECLSVNPHRLGSEILGQSRACEIWKTLSRSAGWSAAAVEASPPIGGIISSLSVRMCSSRKRSPTWNSPTPDHS